MELANRLNGIRTIEDFSNIDVFIICVSTHKKSNIYAPELDALYSIAKKISIEAKDGALVSIESTITKGTSRKVFEIMNHRVHLVHVPHRWYGPEREVHGVNQIRVIGGASSCCLRLAQEFYGLANGDGFMLNPDGVYQKSSSSDQVPGDKHGRNLSMPLHVVSDIETAELTKLVENSYRYVQIAFAEELYLYCQQNNIDFAQLRSAVNTKWNVDILEPREGIGGHCLPKDAKMFLQSSKSFKSKLLMAAMEADDDYRNYVLHRKSQLIVNK
jgi:UDP-N-acetyl-D-mannosaminuronate dehydrogenase